MIAKLYRWLYTRIGRKPWTEIVQDEQRSVPILFMLIFLGLGILIIRWGGKNWWQLLLALLVGILAGHIFW